MLQPHLLDTCGSRQILTLFSEVLALCLAAGADVELHVTRLEWNLDT